MGGSNAAPGDKGLARGQSMVDPKTSAERHGMLFAARPAKREEVASRDVRHPDALMAGQILRDSRRPPRRQIVRCRHHETTALAERAQLHRAVGKRTQAQRDVDALAHQIDTLVGEAEVNPDVGIAILEGKDQPADVQDPESRRAGYPDRAGRSTARAPRLVAGLFDETQDLDAVGIVAAALVGQRDTPRGPAQQRHADGLFELPQMPRDGRLTDAELACDRRQAPALGDADEAAHALESDVRSIHYSA